MIHTSQLIQEEVTLSHVQWRPGQCRNRNIGRPSEQHHSNQRGTNEATSYKYYR